MTGFNAVTPTQHSPKKEMMRRKNDWFFDFNAVIFTKWSISTPLFQSNTHPRKRRREKTTIDSLTLTLQSLLNDWFQRRYSNPTLTQERDDEKKERQLLAGGGLITAILRLLVVRQLNVVGRVSHRVRRCWRVALCGVEGDVTFW